MPKEYSARTTLSDEYKETDIAIGLTKWEARINAQHADEGTNDMEVYCKWLKTEDFARYIAHSAAPASIEQVQDNILYNFSAKKGTLVIQYTDRDPVKAAVTLDSITNHLQALVTIARQKQAQAMYDDYLAERRKAGDAYHAAQERYAHYADTHQNTGLEEETEEEKSLQKDVTLAYKHYEDVAEKCVRQQVLTKRATCVFAVVKPNVVPTHDNRSFCLTLLAIVFVALFLVKVVKLLRNITKEHFSIEWGNIFSPWSITILIWAFVFICIYSMGDKLYPLTSQAYIGLFLWISIFCITSFVVCQLFVNGLANGNRPQSHDLHVNKIIFIILFLITLVASPLCVKKVMDVINMFGTKDLMANIRTLAVHGDGLGILDLCFVINKAVFIVALWKYPKYPLSIILVSAVLVLLNAFAVMDKGNLFFILIVLVFVLYERRKIKLWQIGFTGIAIVVAFFVLTIMRTSTDSQGHGELDDWTLLDFLATYIFANPVAFGYLPQGIMDDPGANTFFLPYYYIDRFGLANVTVVDSVQEFIYVPAMTNLYTIVQPFFVDFGLKGIAYFAFVYGVFIGWIYALYKLGNDFSRCCYTYLVMVLVLQFGQEQIFLAAVPFLRILFLIYILTQTRFSLLWNKNDNHRQSIQ